MKTSLSNDLQEIYDLPESFHKVGILGAPALKAIVKFASNMEVNYTAETGSGQSTLLFSHLSSNHIVFALNLHADSDTESVTAVERSKLFNSKAVEFIIGPSQITLPKYRFGNHLDIVLLDGPHAYPFPDLEYYYLYPHIRPGGILIVDDLQIPSISNMFSILCEDNMFKLEEIVNTTGFLRRTDAPIFPIHQDNWWLQNYNNPYRRSKMLAQLRHYGENPKGGNPFAIDFSNEEVLQIQSSASKSSGQQIRYMLYKSVSSLFGKKIADRIRTMVRGWLWKG